MVTLLESLNVEKHYKEETLYVAVSLCDRYLINLSINKLTPPCLIMLAVTCTLMAAKLEEPMQPSFTRMLKLLKKIWHVEFERSKLIELEENIIRTLDFELQHTSPMTFLERYLRLFNLDSDDNTEAKLINQSAR